jgi:SagB-type dehydrogenase family enzyme
MTSRRHVDVARLYHSHSAHERAREIEPVLDLDAQPPRLRTFPGAPRTALPARDLRIEMPLGLAIERRRTVRELSSGPMPLATLSMLLHACYGVRGYARAGGEQLCERTVPSAGGRYPLEIYAATRAVTGLADGVHHYDPRAHELELVREGLVQPRLADLALDQPVARDANVVLVITAVRERTMWKYGQRGYRYLFLDAGHVGQNLYLVATALGLGPTAIGGFYDRELGELLGLPSDEEAVYLLCVGAPAAAAGGAGGGREP